MLVDEIHVGHNSQNRPTAGLLNDRTQLFRIYVQQIRFLCRSEFMCKAVSGVLTGNKVPCSTAICGLSGTALEVSDISVGLAASTP